MIVNRSAFSEEDIELLNRRQQKEPGIIFLRAFIAVFGILWFAAGAAELLLLVRYHDESASAADAAIMCGMGLLLVALSLLLWRHVCRLMLKHPSVRAPRTYKVDADGLSAHSEYRGKAAETRFAFQKLEYWQRTERATILQLRSGMGRRFYMCLYDDGYTEGTREELLVLLREKGIREVQ